MKTLSETNPYLQDENLVKWYNKRSVRTSCGVEGISVKDNINIEIDHSRSRKVRTKIQKILRNQSLSQY